MGNIQKQNIETKNTRGRQAAFGLTNLFIELLLLASFALPWSYTGRNIYQLLFFNSSIPEFLTYAILLFLSGLIALLSIFSTFIRSRGLFGIIRACNTICFVIIVLLFAAYISENYAPLIALVLNLLMLILQFSDKVFGPLSETSKIDNSNYFGNRKAFCIVSLVFNIAVFISFFFDWKYGYSEESFFYNIFADDVKPISRILNIVSVFCVIQIILYSTLYLFNDERILLFVIRGFTIVPAITIYISIYANNYGPIALAVALPYSLLVILEHTIKPFRCLGKKKKL